MEVDGVIYCGECGAQNDEQSERCVRCDNLLALPVDDPDSVTGPIPARSDAAARTRRFVLPVLLVAVGTVVLALGAWAAFGANIPGSGGTAVRTPTPQNVASENGTVTPEATGAPGLPTEAATAAPGTPAEPTTAAPEIVPTAIPTSPPRDPTVQPMGRLVFSSEAAVPGRPSAGTEDDRDVYSIRVDGTGRVRLTAEAGFDGQPVWAPTGEAIVFSSDRTGLRQIWTMDADGGRARQLTDDPNGSEFPDWSPDGKLIAYEGGPELTSDIWTVPANGGQPVRLTSDRRLETAPAWSPTGDRIVFMCLVGKYYQLFVMDADGRNVRQITRGNVDHRFPRWFPDGRRILYNTRTGGDDPQPGQIHLINADGTNDRQITRDSQGRNGRAYPSPDGRYIAFNSDREDGNYEIYVMRPDGTEVRRITRTPRDDFEPSWSP
jgi:TolB protein